MNQPPHLRPVPSEYPEGFAPPPEPINPNTHLASRIANFPPNVLPHPTPTNIYYEVLQTPQGNMIMLVITSATGYHFYYWDPDTTAEVADQLGKAAQIARSGLHLPPGV